MVPIVRMAEVGLVLAPPGPALLLVGGAMARGRLHLSMQLTIRCQLAASPPPSEPLSWDGGDCLTPAYADGSPAASIR